MNTLIYIDICTCIPKFFVFSFTHTIYVYLFIYLSIYIHDLFTLIFASHICNQTSFYLFICKNMKIL